MTYAVHGTRKATLRAERMRTTCKSQKCPGEVSHRHWHTRANWLMAGIVVWLASQLRRAGLPNSRYCRGTMKQSEQHTLKITRLAATCWNKADSACQIIARMNDRRCMCTPGAHRVVVFRVRVGFIAARGMKGTRYRTKWFGDAALGSAGGIPRKKKRDE